jgi:putative protease
MGFKGVIISPELGRDDYYLLPKQSPLPLGIVISGNWPLCISRIFSEGLKTERTFTSPKGEKAWASKFGSDYWIYPNWILDIRSKQDKLKKAGYCQFVHLVEPLPKDIRMKKRPGLWNWELGVL